RSGAGRRASTATARPSASRRSTNRRPRKPVPPVTRTEPVGMSGICIRFVALGADRPSGERQPMNFRVMADIDRELRVKIKKSDRGGMRMLPGEGPQLSGPGARLAAVFRPGFDHEGGPLRAARAETDKSAAPRLRMGAKYLFTRFGEHRPGRRLDPLRLAAAKPQPSVRVEITAVTHAMPDRAIRAGNLGRGGGLGQRVVGFGHDRSLHDDLAD